MSTRPESDTDVDREVGEIVRALSDAPDRALTRSDLGRRVRCRTWGPGRFRRALAEALGRGLVRRTGRGRYEATGAA